MGAGKNSSSEDSLWVNNTTTLIGGGKVNITADKTTVTGGIIANATRNNDGSLTDHGNMNLVTDELIINDLQDYNRTDSKGIDLSAGLSKNGTSSVGLQKDGHNTEHNLAGQPSWNAEGSPKGRLQDVGDQTTYATLGGGTVTKKSGEQHDVTNVNRDLNNTQEITLDQQTAGLDATVTVDHRLATKEGQNAIKKDFDETGTLMQEVDNVLPSANNENQVLAGIGKTLDVLSTVTGGIIPADATEGGLIAQIPILIGQEDIKHEVIGEGNKVYANGIMNNLENAKQGADNIIGEGDKQIWWNPSRGIVSDLLESSVDLLNGIGLQTGISKQAERFQKENEGKEFYLHSQAHIIFKEGAANTGSGNTYNSYGSPLPESTVKETFKTEVNRKALEKNDGDYVAKPLNMFNPSTWSKPGHGTENYGAARDKKLNEANK